MTTRTRLSILLISTPLLAFVVVGGLLGKSGNDDKFQHLRVFEDVVSLILNNYVEEVKPDRVMEGAMRGLADGLDADSAYLTPDEVKGLDTDKTPAGDVGIELTRQYYLRIIAARDDSPAAKAGLQTGDYVRAIDGKPTRDLSVFEGMRMLRGTPGTKTILTIIRGNAAEPREITLVRAAAPGAVVASRMIRPELGYLRIAAFGKDAPAKVRAQADDLVKAGAKHLIVDIRRDAEGPFDTGLETARLFVKSGTLAQIAGHEPALDPARPPDAGGPSVADTNKREGPARDTMPRQTIAARPGDGSITVPVTILSTTGTSGAAELFAAALLGNHRADMIGEHTLGRAGIQKFVPLPEGRGLWLTYARYLTPAGDPISGRGLTPSIEVDEPEVDFDMQKPAGDPILDAAVAQLQKKAA